MLDLSRVREREALPPRREPYWHRLKLGCFVGFRPSRKGGGGTWIARGCDEQEQAYRLKSLGDLSQVSSRDRFANAKDEAEAFATVVDGAAWAPRLGTIKNACELYAETRADIQARFRRHVYGDPIAAIKLTKLRRSHLTGWRERLALKPVCVTQGQGLGPSYRPRSAAAVNRDMAMLRAALNRILAPGAPNTEAAWQEGLRPMRNADRQRTLYLDRDQRRRLLDAIDAEAEPFVRTLCLLPLRPGAVAALNAEDFDGRTAELSIGKDKSGKLRRLLLPAAAVRLFQHQCVGRPPGAPLIVRSNGKRWDKDSWKRPIARAAAFAGLPEGTTAYTLRHSTITDLVDTGLPLLTVGQISNTSVEMIERHYGHLNRSGAFKALESLTL